MKKTWFFLLFFLFILNVNANDFNVEIKCPISTTGGALITCEINGNSSFLVKEVSFDYNFGTSNERLLTYNKYEITHNFPNLIQANNTGIKVGNSSGISNKFLISKVILRVPVDAIQNTDYITGITNVKVTDMEDNETSVSGVNTTVRIKSDINTLESLTLNNKVFEFHKDVLTYEIELDAETTIINATMTDPHSVVVGTGTKPLEINKINQFQVTVTSETNINKTYILNIKRIDSRNKNNNLLAITFSNGSIVFDQKKTNYNLTIDSESTTITYITEDPKAKVIGAGLVHLKYGTNIIELKVLAENEEEKIYILNIKRPDPRNSNNNLKKISVDVVDIGFKNDILNYNFSVEYNIDEINIDLETEEKTTVVVFEKKNILEIGKNIIEIKVISESEEERIYTLTITRNKQGKLPSDNAEISNLILEKKNIKIKKNKTYYSFYSEKEKLEITVVLSDKKATYEILNNNKLKLGSEITIRVVSESGKVNNYIVGIVKETKIFPIIVIIISFGALGYVIYWYFNQKRFM